MTKHPASSIEAVDEPVLLRTLEAAGLPTTGHFRARAGWVSRAWVGDDVVIRVNNDVRHRDAYRHEAAVAGLLTDSAVPHARLLAHGDGPDGPWCVFERLPGRSLHEAWPTADPATRRTIIEGLEAALRALHHVPVPDGLLPPWLVGAFDGEPWPAFHPPVVGAALQLVEAARRLPAAARSRCAPARGSRRLGPRAAGVVRHGRGRPRPR